MVANRPDYFKGWRVFRARARSLRRPILGSRGLSIGGREYARPWPALRRSGRSTGLSEASSAIVLILSFANSNASPGRLVSIHRHADSATRGSTPDTVPVVRLNSATFGALILKGSHTVSQRTGFETARGIATLKARAVYPPPEEQRARLCVFRDPCWF